jgi:hypothetical protein
LLVVIRFIHVERRDLVTAPDIRIGRGIISTDGKQQISETD